MRHRKFKNGKLPKIPKPSSRKRGERKAKREKKKFLHLLFPPARLQQRGVQGRRRRRSDTQKFSNISQQHPPYVGAAAGLPQTNAQVGCCRFVDLSVANSPSSAIFDDPAPKFGAICRTQRQTFAGPISRRTLRPRLLQNRSGH